jgi:23S rRNA (cytidine1920-2'-O)/16S rRNA (cytidine1409-2'-O)-methyltransferase
VLQPPGMSHIIPPVPAQKKTPTVRLDLLMVEKGLAETQEKAQALVLAGEVAANGISIAKPGTAVPADAVLSVSGQERFVGRGGLKLEHALSVFSVDVADKVALDVGASTGGFTDCLLQHGARRVYAVDVGKGQLAWRLRSDTRVVTLEGVNARNEYGIPEPVDLVTIDVSFISVTMVIPPASGHLRRGGSLIVLVKPQFEAKRREVGRGGVIRDAAIHATVLGRFVLWAVEHGFRIRGLTMSPITGASGNTEFFVLLRSAPELCKPVLPGEAARFDPR